MPRTSRSRRPRPVPSSCLPLPRLLLLFLPCLLLLLFPPRPCAGWTPPSPPPRRPTALHGRKKDVKARRALEREMRLGEEASPGRKSRGTCLGIVPPYFFSSSRGETGSAWDEIQRLRHICRDDEMYSIPPHIALMYPFAPRPQIPMLAARVADVVDSQNLQPFQIVLDTLTVIRRRDTSMVVLEPDAASVAGIRGLWEALKTTYFQAYNDVELQNYPEPFRPLLVLGRFASHDEAHSAADFLQKSWEGKVVFSASELHCMGRDRGPFVCDARVSLGDLPEGISREDFVDLTVLATELEEEEGADFDLGPLGLSAEDVEGFDAFDADESDEEPEGSVFRVGRTTFFTGEMGEYDG